MGDAVLNPTPPNPTKPHQTQPAEELLGELLTSEGDWAS